MTLAMLLRLINCRFIIIIIIIINFPYIRFLSALSYCLFRLLRGPVQTSIKRENIMTTGLYFSACMNAVLIESVWTQPVFQRREY